MSSSNNNTTYKKTSFLVGNNSEFINEFYADYLSDPKSLPESWKIFFDGLSEEQKLIYEVVLEAHKKSMEEIKPGNPWNKTHEKSVEVITDGLNDLGLLQGNQDYSKFYMHRIGHWLGMDVHDVGNYKRDGEWRDFEPGIYILDSLEDVDTKWLGIGIRIEDDVLVTETGFEILTPDSPREISDIENLKA